MSKRNPYSVTFPARETRSALVLRASGIPTTFRNAGPDSTQTLMITDDEAANLKQDGWGVVSLSDPGIAEVTLDPSPPISQPQPQPRRRRRGV